MSHQAQVSHVHVCLSIWNTYAYSCRTWLKIQYGFCFWELYYRIEHMLVIIDGQCCWPCTSHWLCRVLGWYEASVFDNFVVFQWQSLMFWLDCRKSLQSHQKRLTRYESFKHITENGILTIYYIILYSRPAKLLPRLSWNRMARLWKSSWSL